MVSEDPNLQTETFISRWQGSGASERSNAQLFLNELCDLLDLPHPNPAGGDNAYVFERDVTFQKVDGSTAPGRIDLYKRDGFVLEAKQGSEADGEKVGHGRRGTPAWEQAMIKARIQADRYIRALLADENSAALGTCHRYSDFLPLSYSSFTLQGIPRFFQVNPGRMVCGDS